MDEITVRRHFIKDREWDRTSESWKLLKPYRNFDHFDESDETAADYQQRIQNILSVPLDVVEQWLYCHYYNAHTVNNYGWLDFFNVEISRTDLSAETLLSVNVIDDFRQYVDQRSVAKAFCGFKCIPKDLDYWQNRHSWRVPPVIIDVTTFQSIPQHAELHDPLQLVEGHTRFGYLLALNKCGILAVNSQHSVYVIRAKGT